MTERENLKRLARLKYQLGEQIIKCGLHDESLGKAVLLFAEASYQCLLVRDIHFTVATSYAYATYSGVHRNPAPASREHGMGEHERLQNKHAEKCLRQWDGETQFALNALDAAINASTNPRLSVRLMAARNVLNTATAKRGRAIRETCSNVGSDAKALTKGQRAILDYAERYGELHFVTSEGTAHLFPTAEKAVAFSKTIKAQQDAEAAGSLYQMEGFQAFASFCESAIGNPSQWDEFKRFLESKRATR